MAKCWPQGLSITKIYPYSSKKWGKTNIIVFLAKNVPSNTRTLKFVHSKLPVHGHDPKFTDLNRYKLVH